MENATDFIAAVERLGSFLILFLGAVGALYTAISVGRKAMIEARAKAENDKGLLEISKKQKALEATKAMQDLYDEFVADTNEKFSIMAAEIRKLEQVTRERNVFKEAGIRLINAIEEGLEMRSTASAEVNNCIACTIADKALLKTLNEVKTLFENGVK